ncbi:hypothetical protein Tco_0542709 [Tanacetum coccineum]
MISREEFEDIDVLVSDLMLGKNERCSRSAESDRTEVIGGSPKWVAGGSPEMVGEDVEYSAVDVLGSGVGALFSNMVILPQLFFEFKGEAME